jgi:hypothetical protein
MVNDIKYLVEMLKKGLDLPAYNPSTCVKFHQFIVITLIGYMRVLIRLFDVVKMNNKLKHDISCGKQPKKTPKSMIKNVSFCKENQRRGPKSDQPS